MALIVSLEEWRLRKRFVNFEQPDIDCLIAHRELAESYVDELVAEFYYCLKQFPRSRALLANQSVIGTLERLQKTYFLELFVGDYGEDYLRKRLAIGHRHRHIRLSLEDYIGAYNIYLQLLSPRVLKLAPERKAVATLNALTKLLLLDMGLAVTAFQEGLG